MDAQDKKSKDWTLFGRTEDNAIARAKYKREMGINPKAKIESNAEVSRSAKSMKNPTSRPYDPADSAKVAALRKKEPIKAVGGQGFQAFGKQGDNVGTILRHGSPVGAVKLVGSTHPKQSVRDDVKNPEKVQKVADAYEREIYGNTADRTSRKTFGSRTSGPAQKRPSGKSNPVVAPAASQAAPAGTPKVPKPKMKPVVAASDKSSQAGKMTNFQRMKARQFEKEGVAGRSMTREAAKKKAMEKVGTPKMSGLMSKLSFGTKKTDAPKKVDKPAGKSKAELAAWFRSKRQGLAK